MMDALYLYFYWTIEYQQPFPGIIRSGRARAFFFYLTPIVFVWKKKVLGWLEGEPLKFLGERSL